MQSNIWLFQLDIEIMNLSRIKNWTKGVSRVLQITIFARVNILAKSALLGENKFNSEKNREEIQLERSNDKLSTSCLCLFMCRAYLDCFEAYSFIFQISIHT